MSDPKVFWNRRLEEDRAAFAGLLAPLIVASRCKDFDGEKAKPQLHTWMLSLQDVPKDVLRIAVERLINRGVTWMPKPGDVRAECATVIGERYKALAPRAAAISAECEYCHGSTFEPVTIGGVDYVRPCGCRRRVQALYQDLPTQLVLAPAPDGEEPF